tara:strand:+ start:468 stop:1052 length:585 start_codon:yes stop_codon:yes gene_type:complete
LYFKNNMQIHEQLLFPNFFYTTMLDDINQSNIKKFIFDIEKEDLGRTYSNAGGWQGDLKNYSNGDIDMLVDSTTNICQEVANTWEIDNTIVMHSAWANINRKRDFNHAHYHPNCYFSVIYYVAAESDCGGLIFNRPDLQGHYISNHNSSYTEKCYRIIPQTNLLVIFPSYLNHYVEPNLSDTARISIAMNFGIE